MKKSLRYMAAALTMAAAILPTSAQELRTSYFMETSNYRHQMNPALLDSPYFGMFFSNINVGMTGNIGAKQFIFDTNGLPGYTGNYRYTTFMDPNVDAKTFLNKLHDKNRFDLYLNYNLFSVGFKAWGGVNLLELNLRSNTNLTLPKGLFEFAKTAGEKEHYEFGGLGMRTQNYMELALGHSRDINNQWRVGGKLKFLIGAAYADFTADNVTLDMTEDAWRIQSNAQMKASLLKSDVIHEDPSKNSADGRPRVKELDNFGFSLPGFGMALDLGVTYKPIENLTLSAAITDLGFISWKNTHHASSQGDYTFDGFDNIYIGSDKDQTEDIDDQFDQIGDDLEEMFSVYDDGTKTATQALAATLNVGAEYKLPAYDKLKFGFLYTSRIHGKYSWHQGMLNVGVRPVKWFECNVNGAVTSTGVTAGGMLSLKAPHFNFYIAADRFFSKMGKQGVPLNSSNGNITFGMTFPL
ncbi:MAG: DUF5723 family protein [Bacteroidales bacterium]|nr:DUF5723 family protein [Bacteroidales bacterium]MDY2705133.1 DUF5723 family protein [Alloprevotella sp.]